jgi:hypothetical protein
MAVGLVAALAGATVAWGQQGGGGEDRGNGRQNGGPGGGFGGGPEAVSNGVNLVQVKSDIGASDEEWKVIGPKVVRVMSARAATEATMDPSTAGGQGGNLFGGPGGGPGGRGGRGMGNDSFGGPGGAGVVGLRVRGIL